MIEAFVNNIIPNNNENIKYIFVLESPHLEEIAKGYPLAGQSGFKVSKTLFDINDKPFGLLVKEDSMFNKIAIVNVSKYPLQSTAYSLNNLNESELLKKLNLSISIEEIEEFRENLIKRSDSSTIYKSNNPIYTKIFDRTYEIFKNENKDILENKIVIPCGSFAKAYVRRLAKELNFTANYNIPHPSFNNWGKDKHKNSIDELKKLIKGEE